MRIALILLAAGGSTRLGSPKQLLDFGGRSLLRRAAETALASGCEPVVVVLGADATRMQAELAGLAVRIVENPAWERGMGGSVRRGLAALDEWEGEPMADRREAVMLTLCDQPLVGAEALQRMAAAFGAAKRGDAIAAAAYDGTVGVPVVLGRTYFEELRTLPENAGAKGLLRRYAERVVAVSMPEAAVDVDTREQYEKLCQQG